MSWLSDFFGGNGRIIQALREGAVIIDLRTAYEYDQGHIPHSLNIPVDRIRVNIVRIRDLNKQIVLCCSSGAHCREASDLLRDAGISGVHNGGNWQSLLRIVQNA